MMHANGNKGVVDAHLRVLEELLSDDIAKFRYISKIFQNSSSEQENEGFFSMIVKKNWPEQLLPLLNYVWENINLQILLPDIDALMDALSAWNRWTQLSETSQKERKIDPPEGFFGYIMLAVSHLDNIVDHQDSILTQISGSHYKKLFLNTINSQLSSKLDTIEQLFNSGIKELRPLRHGFLDNNKKLIAKHFLPLNTQLSGSSLSTYLYSQASRSDSNAVVDFLRLLVSKNNNIVDHKFFLAQLKIIATRMDSGQENNTMSSFVQQYEWSHQAEENQLVEITQQNLDMNAHLDILRKMTGDKMKIYYIASTIFRISYIKWKDKVGLHNIMGCLSDTTLPAQEVSILLDYMFKNIHCQVLLPDLRALRTTLDRWDVRESDLNKTFFDVIMSAVLHFDQANIDVIFISLLSKENLNLINEIRPWKYLNSLDDLASALHKILDKVDKIHSKMFMNRVLLQALSNTVFSEKCGFFLNQCLSFNEELFTKHFLPLNTTLDNTENMLIWHLNDLANVDRYQYVVIGLLKLLVSKNNNEIDDASFLEQLEKIAGGMETMQAFVSQYKRLGNVASPSVVAVGLESTCDNLNMDDHLNILRALPDDELRMKYIGFEMFESRLLDIALWNIVYHAKTVYEREETRKLLHYVIENINFRLLIPDAKALLSLLSVWYTPQTLPVDVDKKLLDLMMSAALNFNEKDIITVLPRFFCNNHYMHSYCTSNTHNKDRFYHDQEEMDTPYVHDQGLDMFGSLYKKMFLNRIMLQALSLLGPSDKVRELGLQNFLNDNKDFIEDNFLPLDTSLRNQKETLMKYLSKKVKKPKHQQHVIDFLKLLVLKSNKEIDETAFSSQLEKIAGDIGTSGTMDAFVQQYKSMKASAYLHSQETKRLFTQHFFALTYCVTKDGKTLEQYLIEKIQSHLADVQAIIGLLEEAGKPDGSLDTDGMSAIPEINKEH